MKTLIAFIREIWHLIRMQFSFEFDPLYIYYQRMLIRETRRRQQARQALLTKWAPPTEQEFKALVELKWANQAVEHIQNRQLRSSKP